MIAIISPAQDYSEEVYWVNKMMEKGLDLYHLRKPFYSIDALLKLCQKIDSCYWSRIVIHAQYLEDCIDSKFKIHLSTVLRNEALTKEIPLHTIFSTSTHSIMEFNGVSAIHQAFLGPFYDSISKPNYSATQSLWTYLSKRDNYDTQLIALGGIQACNISEIYPKVDGVALLGAIWEADNPLESYLNCKSKVV